MCSKQLTRLSAFFVLCFALSASAEDALKPIKILLVGNSQCPTIVANQLLEKLAASDKGARPIQVSGAVRGGASLKSHWEAGDGPETARGKIAAGKFDFVVLQDIYFVEETAFQPYARQFNALIKEHGSTTVLFGTASILSDYPKGFERLSRLHTTMGKELNCPIVDASQAYFRYFGDKPSTELMESLFAKDKAHPGLQGSYLYSCLIYSVLSGRTPVGLAAPEAIPGDVAKKLQETAWAQHQETSAALKVTSGDPQPPPAFKAVFNGQDLAGWYGHNPHNSVKLTGEKKNENLAEQRAEFAKHWKVENGELVNGGSGPYATTDAEFGDMELRLEYKTVAGADSGIYLRGTPQVQIWDWHQVFNPKNPTRKPHLGSGGLFNNTPNNPGRDPLVLADRPLGEWNQFRIRQIGDRTWVWLNDQLVVDNAPMENFWDRKQPLPAKGPIMLQTHGGEIRWRNIFVHEIRAEEGKKIVAEAEAETKTRLKNALTLHASFDTGLDADFARGEKACYVQQGKELIAAAINDDVKIAAGAGKFGGALHFPKKSNYRPAFKDGGVLGYNDKQWNATVSIWLRLDPDKDLEPGYCDPVQIVGDDNKKGFIFLEWSKDETPRLFRYAMRPLFHIWNPDNVQWADIAVSKRPMVQVEKAPFSRDAWTHAVFTIENVNDKTKPQSGRLYLNGKRQGAIENWDLTFGWDPNHVLLVLGAAYVGHVDDLAIFNRSLNDNEVRLLYELKEGARELR